MKTPDTIPYEYVTRSLSFDWKPSWTLWWWKVSWINTSLA